MKKLIWTLLTLLITLNTFGQKYNDEYGEPILVLIEQNPWKMVIGSDTPTFALYENGQIIYKQKIDEKIHLLTVKLTNLEKNELLEDIIDFNIFNEDNFIVARRATDQPTNIFILTNSDSTKTIRVYGDLESKKIQRTIPKTIARLYKRLSKYQHKESFKWSPDNIEVMVWDYSHSTEIPKKWPKEWPDLNNSSTIDREGMYSIYLDKNDLPKLKEFISELKRNQAIEINGLKMSISYRMPFPNIN